MKKYSAKLIVNAEPVVYGIYAETYGEEKNEAYPYHAPGYAVEHEDGERVWMPAEKFEALYKPAEDFLERVIAEADDLHAKTAKLTEFMATDKYGALPKPVQGWLTAQLAAMNGYGSALMNRIDYLQTSDESGTFGFGVAIALLNAGFLVRRKGWNGKGLSVVKQVPASIGKDIVPNMQSLPQAAKAKILATKGKIDYTCQCLIYNEETGRADSWVPSISDVFATDWQFVTD